MQPGLFHPENQQLPTSRLFINHARTSGVVLWSYHANIARRYTGHLVPGVALEEKNTEGGEKDRSSVRRFIRWGYG